MRSSGAAVYITLQAIVVYFLLKTYIGADGSTPSLNWDVIMPASMVVLSYAAVYANEKTAGYQTPIQCWKYKKNGRLTVNLRYLRVLQSNVAHRRGGRQYRRTGILFKVRGGHLANYQNMKRFFMGK